MPLRPLHKCNRVGCTELTRERWCPAHTKAAQVEQDERRGSRHERGYDVTWVRFRAVYLKKPGNQLCRECLKQGRTTVATDADHIRRWQSGATAAEQHRLKYDETNLQPLCHPHHSAKTAREDGAFGRKTQQHQRGQSR